MNTLNKTDVFVTANNLIKLNGQTTNLEIKTELRNLGFYATQNQVSNFMNELYNEEQKWDYSFNREFRTYSERKLNDIFDTITSSFTDALKIAAKINSDLAIDDEPTALANSDYRLKDTKPIDDREEELTYQSKTECIWTIKFEDIKAGDLCVWSTKCSTEYYFPKGQFTRTQVRNAYTQLVKRYYPLFTSKELYPTTRVRTLK